MTLSFSLNNWTVIFKSFPGLLKAYASGLKVKLTKCKFLKSFIEFPGHLIDEDCIYTDDSKIPGVKNFPTPKSVDNVSSFLGLAGYYRAFAKNCAFVASPLTRFLKKDVPFLWNHAQPDSFITLTLFIALTHAPNSYFPRLQVAFYHVQGRFRSRSWCRSHAN